jgi:xanthine dehydrogenase iron-sulfur cluster and FAD-binding subunit A
MATGSEGSWYRPTTLEQLLQLVHANPGCKMVGGNTEMAIETNIKGAMYKCLIDPTWIPELTAIEELSTGLRVRGTSSHVFRQNVVQAVACAT